MSVEGGRDGCAEQVEDAALDGGGFGQGRDDGGVAAVPDVVSGEGGQVVQQVLVGVQGQPGGAGPVVCFGFRCLASDCGSDGIFSGERGFVGR